MRVSQEMVHPTGGGIPGSPHRGASDTADYSGGLIEVWFSNECREVAGLTHWGSYSYGRWWKGLALQYTKDAQATDDAAENGELFSYAELEHEAAGPALAAELWRAPVLSSPFLGAKEEPCIHICFAKAKAFGIKRIVHRISIPYADLIGRRTTITWVHD